MLYKSCRWTYKETNKIGFAFLWFSMNLYDFSNLWPKHTKEGRIQLQRSPWKVLDLHRNALGPKTLTTMPSVAKRARRRWGGAGDGQQLAPRFNSSRPTSIGSGGTARDVAGERRRRSNGGTAATTGNLVRFGVERVNVPWFDAVSEWSGEFIGSGNGRCGGARCSREEGRATTFYRRERDGEAVRKSSHSMAMVWARHGARQRRCARGRTANGARRRGRPACEGAACGTARGPRASCTWARGTTHRPAVAGLPRHVVRWCMAASDVTRRDDIVRALPTETIWCGSIWPRFSPKTQPKVHQAVIRKIVDLYNFYKGSMVFLSTNFA
jgi:hypothetical protein